MNSLIDSRAGNSWRGEEIDFFFIHSHHEYILLACKLILHSGIIRRKVVKYERQKTRNQNNLLKENENTKDNAELV